MGWEERLLNDLFYVEWDVKPQLNQSINPQADTEDLCVLFVQQQVNVSTDTECCMGLLVIAVPLVC